MMEGSHQKASNLRASSFVPRSPAVPPTRPLGCGAVGQSSALPLRVGKCRFTKLFCDSRFAGEMVTLHHSSLGGRYRLGVGGAPPACTGRVLALTQSGACSDLQVDPTFQDVCSQNKQDKPADCAPISRISQGTGVANKRAQSGQGKTGNACCGRDQRDANTRPQAVTESAFRRCTDPGDTLRIPCRYQRGA